MLSEETSPDQPAATGRSRIALIAAAVAVLVVGAVLLLRSGGPSLGAMYPATSGSPFSFRYPEDWVADQATIDDGAIFVSSLGTPAQHRQKVVLGQEFLAIYGSDIDSRARVMLELQAQNGGSIASPVAVEIDGRPATRWRVTLPGNEEGSAPGLFPRGGVMTGYEIDLGEGHTIHLMIASSEASVDDELFDAIAQSIRFDDELLAQALERVQAF